MTEEEIADKVIMQFENYGYSMKWNMLWKAGFSKEEVNNNVDLQTKYQNALQILIKEGFIIRPGNNPDLYVLEDKGRDAKKAGGYIKVLESRTIVNQQREEVERKKLQKLELEIQKLYVDLKAAKIAKKISIIAIVIAGLSLLFSVYTHFFPSK